MERAVLTISPAHIEDWRIEIVSFLQGNCLLDDEAYIKRMQATTRPYVIIEGELYKQGVCSPLLKCLSRTEGLELMKEIHTCNTPLIPHKGCYQIAFPLNLCNTRKEIEKESIAKSGSTSLERSITRGNIEFIHDIKES
jgi:hypothetical protein